MNNDPRIFNGQINPYGQQMVWQPAQQDQQAAMHINHHQTAAFPTLQSEMRVNPHGLTDTKLQYPQTDDKMFPRLNEPMASMDVWNQSYTHLDQNNSSILKATSPSPTKPQIVGSYLPE